MAGFPWVRLGIKLNIVAVNLLKVSQLTRESIKRPNPGQLARRTNRSSQCQELRHWGRNKFPLIINLVMNFSVIWWLLKELFLSCLALVSFSAPQQGIFFRGRREHNRMVETLSCHRSKT